ncbi:MAG: hypothetical protein WD378_02120 [Egicoccus sp.]
MNDHAAGPSEAGVRRLHDPRYPDSLDLATLMRGGHNARKPIRYSDDVWDLDGLPAIDPRASHVHFNRIPLVLRDAAKDYFLLRGDPRFGLDWTGSAPEAVRYAQTTSGNWNTARAQITLISRRLVEIVNVGLPLRVSDWPRVYDEMVRDYTTTRVGRKELVGGLKPITVARSVDLLRNFEISCRITGYEGFGSTPWGVQSCSEVAGIDHSNRGRRLLNSARPHEDVFAMLGACLNLLDLVADEVIERIIWHRNNGTIGPTKTRNFATRNLANRRVRVDPFDEAHPCRDRSEWLPKNSHLLPTWANRHHTGLFSWSEAIVYASWYALSAICGLREQEISALQPDCLKQQSGGIYMVHGHKIKNKNDNPDPVEWYANANVKHIIGIVNRLRDALDRPPQRHPRFGWPMLFSYNLVSNRNNADHAKSYATTIYNPMDPQKQQATLVSHHGMLAETGHGHTVERLKLVPQRVIRITAIEVHAARRFGDLAAAQVGKWRTTATAHGYYGHLPRVTGARVPITTIMDGTEAADLRTELEVLPLIETSAAQPERLKGRGAARMVARAAGDPELKAKPSQLRSLRRSHKHDNRNVVLGVFSACAGPEGGLCNTHGQANVHLCRMGCVNNVYDPYMRAMLELQRRYFAALWGNDVGMAAQIELTEGQTLADERLMTDDELKDVITAEWHPDFRDAVDYLFGS